MLWGAVSDGVHRGEWAERVELRVAFRATSQKTANPPESRPAIERTSILQPMAWATGAFEWWLISMAGC